MLSERKLDAYRRMTPEERWREVEELDYPRLEGSSRASGGGAPAEAEGHPGGARGERPRVAGGSSKTAVSELPVQRFLLQVIAVLDRLGVPLHDHGRLRRPYLGSPASDLRR